MVLGYPTPLGQDVEASSDVEEELRHRVQIVVATGVGSEDGEVEEDDEDQEGDDEDGVLHHGGDVGATQGDSSGLCVFSRSWKNFQYLLCSCCHDQAEEEYCPCHLDLAFLLTDIHCKRKKA